jgi:hypothetical protein
LAFSNDGTVLAIASSYMYEHDNIPDNIPEDAIYVRYKADGERICFAAKETSSAQCHLCPVTR